MSGSLSSKFKKIRQRISFASLKFFLWVMGFIPRGFVRIFSDALFTVVYPSLQRLKKICTINLQSVYGDTYDDKRYRAMTKACIKFISRGMLDLLYFVQRPQELLEKTQLDHEAYLKEALKKGHGVIVVSAHLGNIPLLFVALSRLGYKVNVIIRPMRDKDFGIFMKGLCARWGINMIETVPLRSFFKKSLQALHKNELLFILLDEVVEDEFALKVNFFNQQVNRAPGPVLFHERSGAPILPVFIVEDQNRQFQICIHKEFELEKGLDETESNLKTIAVLTKIIEDYVSRYPVQWGGWLNKRWVQV